MFDGPSWFASDGWIKAMAAILTTFFLLSSTLFPFVNSGKHSPMGGANVSSSILQFSKADLVQPSMIFLNCVLWSKYAIVNEDMFTLSVNSIGVLTSIISITIFYRKGVRDDGLIITFLFVTFVILFVCKLLVPEEAGMVGAVCMITSVLMLATPLLLQAKSSNNNSPRANHSHTFSTLMALAMNFCWIVYAYGRSLFFMLIPNLIGFVISAIHLVVLTMNIRGDPYLIGSGEKLSKYPRFKLANGA